VRSRGLGSSYYVLSGFVIAHNYFENVSSPPEYLTFLWRRIARLYPLHLLTLAALIALFYFGRSLGKMPTNPERYDLSLLPGQLLMLHAWGIHPRLSFNLVSWSIRAEWFCYIVFPLVALMITRAGLPLTIALTAASVAVLEILGHTTFAAGAALAVTFGLPSSPRVIVTLGSPHGSEAFRVA
jgi:peptidoglycan/LPS O-acetylase OafA/YrhL